jgi:hypothetical protein
MQKENILDDIITGTIAKEEDIAKDYVNLQVPGVVKDIETLIDGKRHVEVDINLGARSMLCMASMHDLIYACEAGSQQGFIKMRYLASNHFIPEIDEIKAWKAFDGNVQVFKARWNSRALALMSQKGVKVFLTEDVVRFTSGGAEPEPILDFTIPDDERKFTCLSF